MIRTMREAIADLQRDIQRWQTELASATSQDDPVSRGVADHLRRWIEEGERIIAGYNEKR